MGISSHDGGVILGVIVSQQIKGSILPLGSREIWSVTIWVLYAILLHGRIYSGWRGRRAASISIIAFIFLLITFFGVNIISGKGLSFH